MLFGTAIPLLETYSTEWKKKQHSNFYIEYDPYLVKNKKPQVNHKTSNNDS